MKCIQICATQSLISHPPYDPSLGDTLIEQLRVNRVFIPSGMDFLFLETNGNDIPTIQFNQIGYLALKLHIFLMI